MVYITICVTLLTALLGSFARTTATARHRTSLKKRRTMSINFIVALRGWVWMHGGNPLSRSRRVSRSPDCRGRTCPAPARAYAPHSCRSGRRMKITENHGWVLDKSIWE
jgi:hypothetical protein